MANIISNNTKTEVALWVNGEDVVDQLMEATDNYDIYTDGDGTRYYILTAYELEWWQNWARIESKVIDAINKASEEQLRQHEELLRLYCDDFEMLHEMECELFGIKN